MKRALEGVKVGDVLYHERSSERGSVLRVVNRVVRVGRKYLYIKEVIATPKGSLSERLGKKEIPISIETGVADGHFGRFLVRTAAQIDLRDRAREAENLLGRHGVRLTRRFKDEQVVALSLFVSMTMAESV